MILYFTGTDNSKRLADILARETGDAAISIAEHVKHGTYPDITDGTLIFSLPVYAWRIPRLVDSWIRSGACFHGQKVYFLLNCGSDMGNAQQYIRQLCEEKGLTFMGCAAIRMPENYIALFDCPSEETARAIVRRGECRMMQLLPLIKDGAMLPPSKITVLDKIKSDFVNDGFYRYYISSKKFFTLDACIGCGKCAQLCPANAIRMENGRPVWGESCTHCMACICHCPTEAIEYGKTSKGKRRYRCPE